MTGGESLVGNADLDSLLLDFMRVLRVYYNMHSSYELEDQHTQLLFDVGRSSELYRSLGITPQPPVIQWMLLVKLCREFAMEFMAATKDLRPITQDDLLYHPEFDLSQLQDEVHLNVNTMPFLSLYNRLVAKRRQHSEPVQHQYLCSLFIKDNQALLNINGTNYPVARLNDDKLPAKLLNKLHNSPPNTPITAREIEPADDNFSFRQFILNYKYEWLRPLLSTLTTKSIALSEPVKLDEQQLKDLLKKIKDKHRKPIEEHLGLET